MKALCHGDRLLRVDKGLAKGSYNGEAIGLARFTGTGRAAFRKEVERTIRTPEGTAQFYLRAIDRLAETGIVRVAPIGALEWSEVENPADLEIARRLTARWAGASLPDDGPVQAQPLA